MELLVAVAIKLAKDLDNIGVGISSAEGVSRAIEAENELGVLILDKLLSVNTRSSRRSRLGAGGASKARHVDR